MVRGFNSIFGMFFVVKHFNVRGKLQRGVNYVGESEVWKFFFEMERIFAILIWLR